MPYSKLDDPQSLNLYAYVGNNPMMRVDPDGHGREKASGGSTPACAAQDTSCKTNPQLCKAVLDAVSSGHSIAEGWANRLNQIGGKLSKGLQSAKKDLDKFNDALGFGKTNCAGGGSCSDALGQAVGAVVAVGASDGESEEPEVATLAERWGKGTFESVEDSLAYHFSEHGAEVDADSLLQYLRKADDFASNLERSKRVNLPDGAVRFIKNGRYLIKDAEGRIVSFGLVSD